MKTIEIPEYVLRGWERHFSRLAANAKADPSDTRTVNALRLARKDVRRMRGYLPEKDTEK